MDNDRFLDHDGSGRPRPIIDPKCTLIERSAVTALDLSLSTNIHATRTQVSIMTIHRRLIERYLSSYRGLHHLPLTPAHCRARFGGCFARSVSFESRSLLAVIRGILTAQRYVDNILRTVLPPFLWQNPELISQQDNARPHMTRVAMNCVTVS
ncbi:hypothetical protein TNCV_4902581 [Trichonephila clavipes]|nr:hypothetical protein TNCV_4902581 [Trichonephila clavipes]